LKKIIVVLLAVSGAYSVLAQNKIGNFYFTWGYQRDHYTTSDIHFKDTKSDNYNFTLENAHARDKPDFDNFFHTALTVPQYVFNVGYFLPNKSNWGIEVSWDHLKYVVNDNQRMHVHGQIRGVPIDTVMLVTPDFVHFEHTNGNNYLMVSAVRKFSVLTGTFNRLSLLTKAGAGGLVPKTDSYIFKQHNDGPFKLSGFVIGVSANLRYEINRYFFIEGGVKVDFADYTSAKVYEQGKANHSFFSLQYIGAAGISVPFHH
jgi:hypothetical protein